MKEKKHQEHKHRPVRLSVLSLVSGKDNIANRSKDRHLQPLAKSDQGAKLLVSRLLPEGA